MTQKEFTVALEAELRHRRAAFDLAELLEFADGVWLLAREDPDARRWAAAFLEARAQAEAEVHALAWFDPANWL